MAQRVEQTVTAYLSNEDSPTINNPIHSTEVAARYGFRGALVGGVTVFGWATDAILQALDEGWMARGWAEFSFRQPTFPGDVMRVVVAEGHDAAPDAWSLTMANQDGLDCVVGAVGPGDAPWLDEFETPRRMNPGDPPEPRPPLTLDGAPVGQDWVPLWRDASVEFAREFAREQQHTQDSRFVGDHPWMHPAWVTGWAEALMRHNHHVPSSMHTRSRLQYLAPIRAGTPVIGGAHVRQAYERRAHHFVEFDVLLQHSDGEDLARLRHWTIFRIATPEERAAAGG